MGNTVLVLGHGGREHAIAWKIRHSSALDLLWVCPDNAGLATQGRVVESGIINDADRLVSWCCTVGVDLVVVGPEQPLVAGFADRLRAAGILVVGPNRDGALLEASKSHCRLVCEQLSIPMAKGRVVDTHGQAMDALKTMGVPVVIKADGLAAGKGVVVASDHETAVKTIDLWMTKKTLGSAGSRLVIEECLVGSEYSFFALMDEKHIIPLLSCSDYKRRDDGNKGSNTGGMGAVTPSVTDLGIHDAAMEWLTRLQGYMVSRDSVYRGVIYLGIMMTPKGPKLLEINVRLGDPECQVLMRQMASDFLPLLSATAQGQLGDVDALSWHSGVTVGVVVSHGDYPGLITEPQVIGDVGTIAREWWSSLKVGEVTLKGVGLPTGSNLSGSALLGGGDGDERGAVVFHAGTQTTPDSILLAKGGRVACATACGNTLADATQNAYAVVKKIAYPQCHYRRDIGRSNDASTVLYNNEENL